MTGSPNSTLPPGSSHQPAYGPRSCRTNVTVSPGPGTTTSATIITRPATSATNPPRHDPPTRHPSAGRRAESSPTGQASADQDGTRQHLPHGLPDEHEA